MRPLERFQAKWKPVSVKKTRQIKNLEPRFDSIETEKALVGGWRIAEIGPQENMRYGMPARTWSRPIWTGQAVLIDASADRHFNRGMAW